MGKAPLILQYLQDHARLVCDRRNEKDGPGTWRITPVPDEQRRNIIFHYGSTSENFHDFFNIKPAKHKAKVELDSPTLNNCEFNLKSLERREMMRMTERKVATRTRITLKPKAKSGGIFLNGIQANQRILVPKMESDDYLHDYSHDILAKSPTYKCNNSFEDEVHVGLPSTSSIYIDSSNDFENDLFNEPESLSQAHYQHQRDLAAFSKEYTTDTGDDWFNETVNFTQSQPRGFIPSHRDHYKFNSQR